jgi:hypothetical protein
MSLEWKQLDHLACAGELEELTGLLLASSEEDRVAFAREFESRVKAVSSDDWWRSKHEPSGGYSLIAIACLPTAARTAALLGRRELREHWGVLPVGLFLEIVRARQLPWFGDLGIRLAGRLSPQETWSGGWPFVSELLQAAAADPPVTEGVVRGWLQDMQYFRRDNVPVPMADRLRASPHLDLLLPSLFTVDGLGGTLNNGQFNPADWSWQSTPEFPSAVAQLVSEGRLDRGRILDATVERLVRGDRPTWLRPFTMLHDALAPTVAELAGHTLDYARLLPDAPSPVATLAQRALRTLDEAGRVELETVLEASHPVLFRKEKGLVKAQLTWLAKITRREPDRIPEVLETVTAALDHPSLDIRDLAQTLINRHGTTAPPSLALPPPALPTPSLPAVLPPPIGHVVELAEEIVALVHDESGVRWERVLAGLVTLRTADNLAETLRPILDRYAESFTKQWWHTSPRMVLLGEALFSVVAPERHTGEWQRMIAAVRAARADQPDANNPLIHNPEGVLALRIAELSVDVLRAPVPELLATPTHVTGSLDAETLLARLTRAEAAGRPPWPADLEQALLRLPRRVDHAVLAAAGKLTTEAGRKFAAWLTDGGLPDPSSTRTDAGTPTSRRLLANLHPARTGGLLENHLTSLTRRKGLPFFVHEGGVLPMVLPHHREISAAWSLPALARTAIEDDRGAGALLPLLADCTGPIGPATTLALTYVSGARHEPDRTAAVDAILTLAASGAPFAPAMGADVGNLCADSTVKLTRVALTLTAAHRAGASGAVWEVLAAAIPLLLPHKPRGLPDLLELATQVATETTTRTELAGLRKVAAQPTNTRLTREAKRLLAALTI